MADLSAQNEKLRRAWAKQAELYDRQMGWWERRVFGGDHRIWACGQVEGDVLEVAIGSGLNLPAYRPGVTLTGIDLSPEMLAIARRRATELGRTVDLREGDAHRMPFPDESFDAVVCTYSLCNIPDTARAIAEMHRVLRPGGPLILVDHVRSTSRIAYGVQKAIEFVSIRLGGEHMTRLPSVEIRRQAFDVVEQERFGLANVVERVVAVKR